MFLARLPTRRKPSQHQSLAGSGGRLDVLVPLRNLEPETGAEGQTVGHTGDAWNRAVGLYINQLPNADRQIVLQWKEDVVLTRQNLEMVLAPLRQNYNDSLMSRFLRTINPIVTAIRSFATVIGLCVQANPNPAALVWGALTLLLEITAHAVEHLELICSMLASLSSLLPLFETWLRLFPESEYRDLSDCITDVLRVCLFPS